MHDLFYIIGVLKTRMLKMFLILVTRVQNQQKIVNNLVKKGFRFGVISSAECYVLGIKCNECVLKRKSRKNYEEAYGIFHGRRSWTLDRLRVKHLVIFAARESKGEAYEDANF